MAKQPMLATQALAARDRDAGAGGRSFLGVPYPHDAQNDLLVRVHAVGFTPGELDWSGPGSIAKDGQCSRQGRCGSVPPCCPRCPTRENLAKTACIRHGRQDITNL